MQVRMIAFRTGVNLFFFFRVAPFIRRIVEASLLPAQEKMMSFTIHLYSKKRKY